MADPAMKQNCGNCKFSYKTQTSVLCRRFPPQLIPTTEGPLPLFPTMQEIGWCGEWVPKLTLQ